MTTGYCAQLNDDLDHANFLVVAGDFDIGINGEESEQASLLFKKIIFLHFLFFYIQCNLDLVTLLVSAKTVTKSQIVTKFRYH